MKNIERTDVRTANSFAEIYEIIRRENKSIGYISITNFIDWLNSEYVEPPHKWEPWELEAMKHIDKKVIKLGRTRADVREYKIMVQIYVELIRKGFRTIEQVPSVIRDKVRKALKEG